MSSETRSRNSVAAMILSLVAAGIAVAALVLWLLDVIGPPSAVVAGATALLTILAAGRLRKGTA